MDNEDKGDNINISLPRKTLYLIAAALLVVVVAVGASLGFLDQPLAAFPELFQEEESGEVVATVNGEEIAREELDAMLEQQKQQYQMQGMDMESEEMSDMLVQLERQILDSLIGNHLMAQAAEEKGISISDEELEEEYQELAAQFGGEEELKQQLEAAGITKEEIKEDIARNLPAQKYLELYMEENLAEEELEFSEEELKALYDQYSAQMGEDFGEFEEVKPQLEQELRQQKENEIIQKHLEDLREQGEIEIKI